MIRFQADADVHHGIVVAVRRREPAINFASAADSELEGVSDPDVLEIAASQGRILITHDRRTMLEHFPRRLQEEKSSPGLCSLVDVVQVPDLRKEVLDNNIGRRVLGKLGP